MFNNKDLNIHNKLKTPLPIQTKSDYELKIAQFYKALRQIESANRESKNFKIYSVVDYFCKKKCKIKSDHDMPLYFDTSHLTLTGAEMLSGLFERVLMVAPRRR